MRIGLQNKLNEKMALFGVIQCHYCRVAIILHLFVLAEQYAPSRPPLCNGFR